MCESPFRAAVQLGDQFRGGLVVEFAKLITNLRNEFMPFIRRHPAQFLNDFSRTHGFKLNRGGTFW